MLNHDKCCLKCYLRSPHKHYYVYHEDNEFGFDIRAVETYYIKLDIKQAETDPLFIAWVNDEWKDDIIAKMGKEKFKEITLS